MSIGCGLSNLHTDVDAPQARFQATFEQDDWWKRDPIDTVPTPEISSEVSPATGPLSDDPDGIHALLGINCRGAAGCKTTTCGKKLEQLIGWVNRIDDNRQYSNNENLACVQCEGGQLCAFFQRFKEGSKIRASWAKSMMNRLVNIGCTGCDSVPYWGNDVKDGEITVNFFKDREKRVVDVR